MGQAVQSNPAASNYSFKCHRYDIKGNLQPGVVNHGSSVNGTGGSSAQSSQHVFAVNDICFHPKHETFCTAGADGSITFWDGIGRTKLKG
jgi:mRNA export factor